MINRQKLIDEIMSKVHDVGHSNLSDDMSAIFPREELEDMTDEELQREHTFWHSEVWDGDR